MSVVSESHLFIIHFTVYMTYESDIQIKGSSIVKNNLNNGQFGNLALKKHPSESKS